MSDERRTVLTGEELSAMAKRHGIIIDPPDRFTARGPIATDGLCEADIVRMLRLVMSIPEDTGHE